LHDVTISEFQLDRSGTAYQEYRRQSDSTALLSVCQYYGTPAVHDNNNMSLKTSKHKPKTHFVERRCGVSVILATRYKC